jgi:oxygen-independent coproporphyrinogen-3 oxidase
VEAARAFIDRNLSVRQVNKILHSFPSPKLWHEAEVPLRNVVRERRAVAAERRLGLYMGMPYCLRTNPDRCGYCLFPVEVYTGNNDLEAYAGYLGREGKLYEGQFGDEPLRSIYFGGGTANLYRADMYPKLMSLVRRVFEIADDAIVTLEGIPQLFTREKIAAIKDAGMNRISMGAQQLNDELNKLSGRKQTVKHVLQSIEWCAELDLPCNVDLIFGWPRQTVSTMLRDLELLVSTGVHHVTHYELNVGGPTDFALNRRHELPSVAENLEMYRVSRDFLLSKGYRQLTAYDWEKGSAAPLYEECSRDFVTEMFGWGYAAVSALEGVGGAASGWMWRNQTSVADYFRSIEEGRVPIGRGFRQAPVDLRLSRLFSALQGTSIDLEVYRAKFGVDLLEEHAGSWEALRERGFVEVEGRVLRLVGDGVFYTPMIQTLLSRQRIAELTASLREQTRSLPLLSDEFS